MEKSILDPIYLWQQDLVTSHFVDLKVAAGTAEHSLLSSISSVSDGYSGNGTPFYNPSYPSGILKCSCCHLSFGNREEQVAHYVHEWHQFNMKRSLNGMSAVSKEKFEFLKAINFDEDISSNVEEIHEDEKNEETSETDDTLEYKRSPYVFFENADKKILGIYRTVLFPKKTNAHSLSELISRGTICPSKLYWTIILLSGGNFAGAVFKGEEVVVHKSFHSYTVRAKQGGSQSSHDNQKGRFTNSAGANLRRYNEQSFTQHVQEILSQWKNHIENCDLIFYRCPMSSNQILFGGNDPVLNKGDFRLRTIPIPTKKPNYSEVKRIHSELSMIVIYDKDEFKKISLENAKPLNIKDSPKQKRNMKKDRKEEIEIESYSSSETESDLESMELVYSMEELDFQELREYGHYIPEKRREIKTKNENNDNYLRNRTRTMAYMAARSGNLELLKAIHFASNSPNTKDYEELLGSGIFSYLQKQKFDIFFKSGRNEKNLLHIAAENSQNDVIWWLLEQGCDPSVPDNAEKMPYSSGTKKARLIFRRFMSDYPEKFNYKKAGISSPLSKEDLEQFKQQNLEKKKQQKSAKKAKQKENKRIISENKKLEEEKQRFLNLSEREKRALAAEMRILTSGGNIYRQRCFQCGIDISGVVPFEYSESKFCSTVCVREHRKANR